MNKKMNKWERNALLIIGTFLGIISLTYLLLVL